MSEWVREGSAALFGLHEYAFFITFGVIWVVVIFCNNRLWRWQRASAMGFGKKVLLNVAFVLLYIVVATFGVAALGHFLAK